MWRLGAGSFEAGEFAGHRALLEDADAVAEVLRLLQFLSYKFNFYQIERMAKVKLKIPN